MKRPLFLRFSGWLAPHSLKFQLLSRSLVILACLLLLIGAFQYVLMRSFIYANQEQNVISQIRSMPPQFWGRYADPNRSGSDKGGGMPRDPALFFRFPESSLAFVNPEGQVTELREETFRFSSPSLSPDLYRAALATRDGKGHYQIVTDPQEGDLLVVLVPLNDRGRAFGLIQISTSTRLMDQVLVQELIIYSVISVLALLIGWAAFSPVLRRSLVPLNRMVDTVEQINAGNLKERLPTDQKQMEIDRLSASFNAMLERLDVSFETEKEAREQMRRFVADASHELRTPLTSIHGFLEVLLRGAAANPEQLDKALRSMHGESVRLTRLVRDLLYLARLDQQPAAQLQDGLLDEVVHEMEPQLMMLAGKRTVELKVAPKTKASFDRDQMKQVILNLFHNAIQHTDAETGNIVITVERLAGRSSISVRDNGPGIPPEHVPHLFDRFYRADPSRARKHGGAGLGLAITKSIVDLHGGTIDVESEVGRGTTFTVSL